jgi:SulP family sulfate permease
VSALHRYLPITAWLPAYDRRGLTGDAVAGLSVWALLVPQCLAYAKLAGVPVQYGLYTAFVALVAYPLFGTSRQLVQGPSAAVCAVSAAVITPIAGAQALGTSTAVGWTSALAITTGLAYVALGLLRMGWVSTFLSKAVMGGFVLGFALGIVIDQLHALLGVTIAGGSYLEELWQTIEAVPDTSLATLAVGAGSLCLLLAMRRLLPRWPRMLIVVVLAIVVSSALDLGDHGVAITGNVPTGLFSIGLPHVGPSEATALVVGAFSLVFVGYSESLAAARSMARKHHYEIDVDQELLAQGVACGAAGFVGGFATDGSLSKTSVADAAGQSSQIASLVNAALILLTMLFLAGLFESLPGATLAAVVVDAMLGLITLVEWRRYYRVNRADWLFFMGAGLGILAFGIIQGILVGVVLSLLLLIWHSSHTSVREVRYDPAAGVFRAAARHEGLAALPGVVIVRVDGPLFFADADRFRDRVRAVLTARPDTRRLIIDADAIHLTDTDGADTIADAARTLNERGITLALVGLHPPVQALWERAGVFDVIGEHATFDTIAEAAGIDRRASSPSGAHDAAT